MKTGRPAKANTIYKVSIHNNGGRKYASTQPFTVDENGKKHYSHKHWGIVDDNMKFHPNSTYFYAPLEERHKLIFPSDWDLSEIETLSGTGHRGAVEYNGGDLDRMYGPTWFLDNVAKATGLSDDLQKVFGGNAEMAQDVLTLAYYLFLDSRTYSHIEKWQRIVKTPSVHTLTSSSITRLSQSITDRGYESMKNLAVYIAKGQKVITSVKCGQGEALKVIKALDLSTGVPEGMAFSKDTNLFYKQYDLDYKVQGNGDQLLICDAFGFEVPEGCRPIYTSKKSTKGKRVRPPKPQIENS